MRYKIRTFAFADVACCREGRITSVRALLALDAGVQVLIEAKRTGYTFVIVLVTTNWTRFCTRDPTQ